MDDEEAPSGAEICFTQKRCCHSFEESHAAHLWGAMDVECQPIFVANNLRLNWRAAQAKVRLLSSLESRHASDSTGSVYSDDLDPLSCVRQLISGPTGVAEDPREASLVRGAPAADDGIPLCCR
jgi:hypothetical protein